MLISELIAALERAKARYGDIRVLSAWESITPEITAVYRGRGTGSPDYVEWSLLLDSDGAYRAEQEHPDDRELPDLLSNTTSSEQA
jgi:hypothetical protein